MWYFLVTKYMLSIVIPSRNEKFLRQTILDVLSNATGEIEIFPVLDGYELPPEEIVTDPRVHYLRLSLGDNNCHKREAINMMVDICKGEYIMALDAHCMMAKGFDEQLIKDHESNWVQVPRRHRLDADNWCIQEQSDSRPPIDYEYLMFPLDSGKTPNNPREPKKDGHPSLHGFKWDQRTLARANIPIDEAMTIQGSIWFMTKKYFKELGLMQTEGHNGWFQDGEEVGFKTWLSGGEVMVNKNTWYAHLHKGKHYGRMYPTSKEAIKKGEDYWYDFFVNNRWDKRIHDFEWLIEKFWPLPNWPTDWKKRLWPQETASLNLMSPIEQLKMNHPILPDKEFFGFKVRTRENFHDEKIINEILNEVLDIYKIPSNAKVVIDIGANIGCVSLRAARYGATVYAFEPEIYNFETLSHNVLVNNLSDKIKCINLGVGNPGETKLFMHQKNSGMISSKQQNNGLIIDNPEICNFISIKDVFNNYNIEYCDLLKLDCEGSEEDIIRDLDDDLVKKIEQISVEIHGSREVRNELLKKLSKWYTCVGISRREWVCQKNTNIYEYDNGG